MVNSNSTQQNFTSGDLTVVRRYSDFTWLATQLTRDFPGIILPALPEKQAFGRFSINFVEARRRALEKFLQRIAAHPEIGSADAFRNFLQADDSSLAVAKQESKSSKKAAPKSPMSWFEGTVNTITTGKVCRLFVVFYQGFAVVIDLNLLQLLVMACCLPF